MQESWLGIALMVGIAIMGLIVGALLSKGRVQKWACICAFISLALLLLMFILVCIQNSQQWAAPIFIASLIVVPLVVYGLVFTIQSRDNVATLLRPLNAEVSSSESAATVAQPMSASSQENFTKYSHEPKAVPAAPLDVVPRKQRAAVESFDQPLKSDVRDIRPNDQEPPKPDLHQTQISHFETREVPLDPHAGKSSVREIVSPAAAVFSSTRDDQAGSGAQSHAPFVTEQIKPVAPVSRDFNAELINPAARTSTETMQEIGAVRPASAPVVAPDPAAEQFQPRYGRRDVITADDRSVPKQADVTSVIAKKPTVKAMSPEPGFFQKDIHMNPAPSAAKKEEIPRPEAPQKVSFETCFMKASSFKEQGLLELAGLLFEECAQQTTDLKKSNKAQFEAMACYVKAEKTKEAITCAEALSKNAAVLSPLELVKLNAVLRMA